MDEVLPNSLRLNLKAKRGRERERWLPTQITICGRVSFLDEVTISIYTDHYAILWIHLGIYWCPTHFICRLLCNCIFVPLGPEMGILVSFFFWKLVLKATVLFQLNAKKRTEKTKFFKFLTFHERITRIWH